MALPLYVPFGYITFLVGLLWLFSRHYRSRALRRKPPPPWFPEPHTARDVYVSLLSMDPPPTQPVLVSALLARAMTDVKRILSLKDAKQALTNLLQKGQVGDDLWERLLIAEKELEVELSEVVAEANEFADGWGSAIFGIASEALQATMCQNVYKNIDKQRAIKTAELNASRPFVANPGELRILGSKAAIPAAQPKPPAPPSQAKLAMLETIKAAQAKRELEEQKKQAAQQSIPPSKSKPRSTPGSKANVSAPGSTPGAKDSDSEVDENTSLAKSTPSSASKKKKPKKKKKN